MNLTVMQINRQTYEEFFLLYADGELNGTEKKAVEDFVKENPDLSNEFNMIRDTVMHPDDSIIFENKELLYKNEEDDRKIVYMRWFRIGVAAAVMVALTIAGWLFIDERNVMIPPVAIVEKPVKSDSSRDVTTVEPVSEPASPSGNIASNKVRSDEKRTPPVTRKNKQRAVEPVENAQLVVNVPETNVDVRSTENNPAPENNTTMPATVKAETAINEIDVPVQPREMENAEAEEPSTVQYAHSTFDEEPAKNDMIYFANTSLTKKTKLRGVLRKATRYLDRVTSLQ